MGSVSRIRKEEDGVERIHGFGVVGRGCRRCFPGFGALWGLRAEGNKTKEIRVMQIKQEE